MREIHFTRQFKKDYKKIQQYKDFNVEEFDDIIKKLMNDEILDAKYQDHPLIHQPKEFRNSRDIHLRPDIVIIYQKTSDALKLLRIGNHSNLKLTEDEINN